MRKDLIKRLSAAFIAIGISAVAITPNWDEVVYAKDSTVNLDGRQYELESKSKYVYTDGTVPTTIPSGGSQFGQFSITGDLKPIKSVDGYTSYEVSNGVATLSYLPSGKVIGADEKDWHIIEDKGTEINNEKINDKILSGAIMLQTSIDGQNWITDLVKTNVAGAGTDYNSDFYTTPEIQLLNGCRYKVIIAYEVEKKLDEKKNWIANLNNKKKKKYVEVYEFFLKDTSDAVIADGAHPNTKTVVGDSTKVTNTGKDNGFSGKNDITIKDPHYEWKLGEFSIKGYTNTADYEGEEYFIKNLGDVITLSFTLNQNIRCLNNNPNWSIAEDKNGYDQYFRVPKTNFKHGTLIIQFTDFQGNKTEPIIYTDYLAANAKFGADTKVQFFEEGDYEVALDYEIKDNSGLVSYSDYRMFFTFKIRNGNNMVYAFDKSGQLADKEWTATGFTIKTANSHYLTTTVDKYAVVDGVGGKKLDLSWSRTASDGNTYNEDGVYVVSVTNKYQPNGDVSKTFYVGNDPYIRAIPITGMSIEEIVELIKYTDYDMQTYLDVIAKERKSLDDIVDLVNQGWTIDYGQLIEPLISESKVESEPEIEEIETTDEESIEIESEITKSEETPATEPLEQVEETTEVVKTQEELVEEESAEDEEKGKINPAPFVVILAVVASAGGVFYLRSKNNKKGNEKSSNNDEKGGEE